jgi:hypothetical protein
VQSRTRLCTVLRGRPAALPTRRPSGRSLTSGFPCFPFFDFVVTFFDFEAFFAATFLVRLACRRL